MKFVFVILGLIVALASGVRASGVDHSLQYPASVCGSEALPQTPNTFCDPRQNEAQCCVISDDVIKIRPSVATAGDILDQDTLGNGAAHASLQWNSTAVLKQLTKADVLAVIGAASERPGAPVIRLITGKRWIGNQTDPFFVAEHKALKLPISPLLSRKCSCFSGTLLTVVSS